MDDSAGLLAAWRARLRQRERAAALYSTDGNGAAAVQAFRQDCGRYLLKIFNVCKYAAPRDIRRENLNARRVNHTLCGLSGHRIKTLASMNSEPDCLAGGLRG